MSADLGTPKVEVIRSPLTGDTLLEIGKLPAGSEAVKRIPSLPVVGTGSMDPWIRQIPLFAAAMGAGGAYLLKIPPGVQGQLMQHQASDYLRGTYMTAIQGADGQIKAQAGLQPLSYLQGPLLAFVVMSAVTGQYFQAKIENTMRRISGQIDKMIELILAEKESDLRSIYHFTQYVSENFATIRSQNELRLATLASSRMAGLVARTYRLGSRNRTSVLSL
jgi:hypothetical protein